MAPDAAAFDTAGRIDAELMRLHIGYEQVRPYALQWHEAPGALPNWRVDPKMRLSRDRSEIEVNEWLSLRGIPPEAFDCHLGNRSAVDWLLDQYQMSTDTRRGIISDPNHPDDPQYIPRLVCQVITVTLETVRLVRQPEPAVLLSRWPVKL